MRAQRTGELVTPVVIARHLGITSASTTALLDRLEKSGHIERQPNPEDRRSVLIAATDRSDQEIRHTLTTMHDRMMQVVSAMSEDERRIVVAFLTAMESAVDEIDA
jgi:DNA-binding MarR family transcriptional regulator